MVAPPRVDRAEQPAPPAPRRPDAAENRRRFWAPRPGRSQKCRSRQLAPAAEGQGARYRSASTVNTGLTVESDRSMVKGNQSHYAERALFVVLHRYFSIERRKIISGKVEKRMAQPQACKKKVQDRQNAAQQETRITFARRIFLRAV